MAGGGVLFTFGKYAGDVIHFGEGRSAGCGPTASTPGPCSSPTTCASAPAEALDERRGIAGILCVFHIAGRGRERGDPSTRSSGSPAHANSRTRTTAWPSPAAPCREPITRSSRSRAA